MSAYTTLRELVRSVGGTLVEEHLNPEGFGSAYAAFSGAGPNFRLIWDGKENCGLLQVYGPDETWKDRGPIVRERIGNGFSNLGEFLDVATSLAANKQNE